VQLRPDGSNKKLGFLVLLFQPPSFSRRRRRVRRRLGERQPWVALFDASGKERAPSSRRIRTTARARRSFALWCVSAFRCCAKRPAGCLQPRWLAAGLLALWALLAAPGTQPPRHLPPDNPVTLFRECMYSARGLTAPPPLPQDFSERHGYIKGVVTEIIHDSGRGAPLAKARVPCAQRRLRGLPASPSRGRPQAGRTLTGKQLAPACAARRAPPRAHASCRQRQPHPPGGCARRATRLQP
jgi:hypothetical protein